MTRRYPALISEKSRGFGIGGRSDGSKEDDALQVEGGIQAVGSLWEHSRSLQEVAWAYAYQDQGEVIPT